MEIKPGYAGIYYLNRGIAFNGLGNYNQAIDDFGRAIKIKPDFADAYRKRSIVYFTLCKNYEAVNDLKTAQKFDDLGVSDLKMAAKFGDELARTLLRKKGINW
jgi:tetratricopeptide (TPR) repeat protein